MADVRFRAGVSAALAGNLLALVLWVVLSAEILLRPKIESGPMAVAVAMVVLATLGLGAAWHRSPGALLIVFGMSFVPVGFHALATPGLYRLIGVGDLLALVGALLLIGAAPRAATARSSTLD